MLNIYVGTLSTTSKAEWSMQVYALVKLFIVSVHEYDMQYIILCIIPVANNYWYYPHNSQTLQHHVIVSTLVINHLQLALSRLQKRFRKHTQAIASREISQLATA